MYCTECDDEATCSAIPVPKVTQNSDDYVQSQKYPEYGIPIFQRGRECQTCGHTWVSAELPLSFVEELIELRDALADLKANAESYARESAEAAKSLSRLSESLRSLRALQMYRDTGA